MIRLKGGRVIDPKNDRDAVGDVWIEGERIVDAPEGRSAVRSYDVTGKIVMAGGIDIHSHIASANVDLARLMLPELRGGMTPRRSSRHSALPTFDNRPALRRDGLHAGRRPAVNPNDALHAHIELALTPVIDRAALLILGNEDFLLGCCATVKWRQPFRTMSRRCWRAGRGSASRSSMPAAPPAFKSNVRAFSFDDTVPSTASPRATSCSPCRRRYGARRAASASRPLQQSGLPGTPPPRLTTIEAAEDRRCTSRICSSTATARKESAASHPPPASSPRRVNATPNVTIDVGQVMFGPTVTVSSDTLRQFAPAWLRAAEEVDALGRRRQRRRRSSRSTTRERDFVNALQWAIGLELFLLIDDPWQVYFTTDHPNGAPFTRYPEILHLLMDAGDATRWTSGSPRRAIEMTGLRASDANIRSPRSPP